MRNRLKNNKLRSVLFSAILILLVIALIPGQICGMSSSLPVSAAKTSKIRAGYMSSQNLDVLDKMAAAGMTTALVKFGYLSSPQFPGEYDSVKKWAQECEKRNIDFIPIINFWHREKEWIRPRYFLIANGTKFENTPCPLDPIVYEQGIYNRIMQLAQLSREYKIRGAAVDFELYGADISNYDAFCVCDNCFYTFLADKMPVQADTSVQYQGRLSFLNSKGWASDYQRYYQKRTRDLAAKTRLAVNKINPAFSLGGLIIDLPGPAHKGYAEGFSDANNPVMVFTEQTYRKGYTDLINKIIKQYRDDNIPAQVVAGLWQNQFPPENLAEQCYFCAKQSSGYWIYTFESFSKKGSRDLIFDAEKYWQAYSMANTELKKLDNNPDYATSLKVRAFEAPVGDIDFVQIQKKIKQVNVNLIKESRSVTIRFDGLLFFRANKDDSIEFAIRYGRKSNAQRDFVKAYLLSGMAEVLASGTASSSALKLKYTADKSGTYMIAIKTFGNTAEILDFSHPFGIDISDYVNLICPRGKFYLHRDNLILPAKLSVWVDGPGEAVACKFTDKIGNYIDQQDVLGKKDIILPEGKRENTDFVSLEISPRPGTSYEDVRIKAVSGFQPILYPFKISK